MNDERTNQVPVILLGAALIVGTLGYFRGLSEPVSHEGYQGTERISAPGEGEIRLAPSQSDLALGMRGPNRGRIAGNFQRLMENRPDRGEDRPRATEQEWETAVAARSERRAFDGAPPIIPHDIIQQGRPNCLACHRDGIELEPGLVAPAMSHPATLGVCTQCHVTVGESPIPGDALAGGPPIDNRFEGRQRAGRGARAWPGAAPEVPHTTFTREQCSSCHGVMATGLRTSHPWRQNCLQCHAPSAGIDQQPRIAAETLPLASVPSEHPPPLPRPGRPR